MRAVKNILCVATIAALSATVSSAACGKKDQVHALAMNMYHEARGEGYDAMQMVGEVTLNRVANKHFPNTVCGVVYQARMDRRGNPKRHLCQFSWYCDGRSDKPYDKELWYQAHEIATGLIDKSISFIGISATHYHAYHVNPSWAKKYAMVGRYGGHVFYDMGSTL